MSETLPSEEFAITSAAGESLSLDEATDRMQAPLVRILPLMEKLGIESMPALRRHLKENHHTSPRELGGDLNKVCDLLQASWEQREANCPSTHQSAPSCSSSKGNGTPSLPWEGDDWDELTPLVRHLLRYMHGRDSADLRELCPIVWEKDYADVSESALHSAIHKANCFLGKRERRTLEKVRGEPMLRWA